MEVDVTFIKDNKSLQEKKWKEARWPKLDLHKFVGNTNSKSQFFVWIICGNIRPWLPWWPSFKICNCGKYCCCVFLSETVQKQELVLKINFSSAALIESGNHPFTDQTAIKAAEAKTAQISFRFRFSVFVSSVFHILYFALCILYSVLCILYSV